MQKGACEVCPRSTIRAPRRVRRPEPNSYEKYIEMAAAASASAARATLATWSNLLQSLLELVVVVVDGGECGVRRVARRCPAAPLRSLPLPSVKLRADDNDFEAHN